MSKKVSITGFFNPLLIGILSSLLRESFMRLKKVNIQTDDQNFYKTDVIHSVILNNSDDFDLKFKSSAIRQNKLFTLYSRQVPMLSACKDDNSAYVSKRCAKNYYAYNKDCCREVHNEYNCG